MSEPEFHSIQEPELSETSDMHLLLYPTCFRFALLDIPDLYGMALGQWANPKSWRFGWIDFWLTKWIHHEGREVQTNLKNLNPMLDHFMILNNTMGGGLSPVWSSFHQKGSPSISNVSLQNFDREISESPACQQLGSYHLGATSCNDSLKSSLRVRCKTTQNASTAKILQFNGFLWGNPPDLPIFQGLHHKMILCQVNW